MASSKRSNHDSGSNLKPSQNGSRSPQHSNFDFDFGAFAGAEKKNQNNFGGFGDGIDEIFGGKTVKSNVGGGGGGGSFDYDSIFGGSSKPASTSSSVYVDDIFGGMNNKQSVGVDDLLDKIGGLHANTKSSNEKGIDSDELIPGFGGSNVSNNGYETLSLIPDFSALYWEVYAQ